MRQAPDALRRVIAFSQVDPQRTASRAEIEQVGEMWREPDGAPMPFTATQWMESARPAFSWQARFPMLPLAHLAVEDSFQDGRGCLRGRLWGRVKLFEQRGPEVDRGELYRYLAELPWVPGAYLGNEALSWEELAPDRLQVSATLGEHTLRLVFELAPDGRIIRARAEDRPREVNGVYEDTPWECRYLNWAELAGVVVPTRGEVAWRLPEGEFTYWRGWITDYELGGRAGTMPRRQWPALEEPRADAWRQPA